jgi:regulator of protease activity HflC (stomatin/prohibitin superfamily)
MKYIISGVLAFLVLIFLIGSYTSIDEGERGLVTRFGKTVKVIEPGMNYVGFFNDVTIFQTRNNRYEAIANAGTIDLQTAVIQVAVNYEIDKGSIEEIYRQFGKNYLDRIFTQNVQESVKSVSAKYQAPELITKRDQFKRDVITKLTESVNKYVIITDVTISNIDFSDSFDAAIEQKVVAEQNAAAARNKVETARAEAEAVRLRAQAIQQGGGAEYVQLEWIKKWDGQLPQYMTNGTVPFIGIK